MGILTLETNKYALKLENFEGPLDLLCHLIDKSKMDIYDVKLSDITDQYIEYINEMEKQNLEVTSEFLVIATTLVYLKSKELLPKETEDIWTKIEVQNDSKHKPIVNLEGLNLVDIESMDLSLSHIAEYAVASFNIIFK